MSGATDPINPPNPFSKNILKFYNMFVQNRLKQVGKQRKFVPVWALLAETFVSFSQNSDADVVFSWQGSFSESKSLRKAFGCLSLFPLKGRLRNIKGILLDL